MNKGAFIISMIISLIILSIISGGIIYFLSMNTQSTDDTDKYRKETIEKNMLALLGSMQSVSLDFILDEDDLGFSDLFNPAIQNNKNIKYIYAINSDGIVIGTTVNESEIGRKISNPDIVLKNSDKPIIEWKDNRLYAYYPVGKVGGLYLNYELPSLPQKKASPYLPIGAGVAVFLIGGIIVTVIFGSKISQVDENDEFVGISSEKVQELRREEQAVKTKIENRKKELQDLENSLKEKQTELASLNEQLSSIEEKKKEIESLNSQKEGLERIVSEMEEKRKGLESELVSKKKDIAELENNPEVISLTGKINNLREEISKLTDTYQKYKAELTNIMKEIELKKKELASIPKPDTSAVNADIEKKKAEEKAITQRIINKRREEIALSQRIEMKKRKEQELSKRLELLMQKMKNMDKGNS